VAEFREGFRRDQRALALPTRLFSEATNFARAAGSVVVAPREDRASGQNAENFFQRHELQNKANLARAAGFPRGGAM
jgi:hypothetical protein